MAKVHGKGAKIFVKDSDTTMQDMRGDGNNVTLNLTGAADETTSFGQDWRTRIPGLKDSTIEYSGFFNSTGSTVDATLASIVGGSTSVSLAFAGSPAGEGSPMYEGLYMICTDYSVTGPVDGPIAVSFTLIGGSDMTRQTA